MDNLDKDELEYLLAAFRGALLPPIAKVEQKIIDALTQAIADKEFEEKYKPLNF